MGNERRAGSGTVILGLVALAAAIILLVWCVSAAWAAFRSLNTELAVGLLTAGTTVIVATMTVMLGRYVERAKDHEAAYRDKKTEIYDAFLQEFFRVFHGVDKAPASDDRLVSFLREWQRKMILWGGQDVLKAYIVWMQHLKQQRPDAKSILLTEGLFRAIRRDLGHSSRALKPGMFVHLILRESDLFLASARSNPNMTLAEFATKEQSLPASKTVHETATVSNR